MSGFVIKKMETEDEIKGKGYVHYKAWHEAYKNLIDGGYLEGVTIEGCVEKAQKYPDNTIVAKDGDKVIGFVCYGAYRDDTLSEHGEIYAIYVLADYYSKKVGYELMNAAFKVLSEYKKIAVWVLEGNERAVKFYEKYGFRFDGKEMEITLGSLCTELRMICEVN